MHKALLLAVGLSLAGGAVAQAQPYGPPNGPPPAVRHDPDDRGRIDRDDRGHHDRDEWRRRHHRHRHWVCEWRRHHHPHKVCYWTRWPR